jgi:hypothetical protein
MSILRNTAIVPEYVLKIAAIPGTLTAIGSQGGLGMKTLKGIVNMPATVMNTIDNIRFLTTDLAKINDAYNTMPAAKFVNTYGADAMTQVKKGVAETIQWGENTYRNFAEQPLETLAAGLLTAGIFYGAGRAVRFWRQKGQGSFLDKTERKIGRRFWSEEYAPVQEK